MRESKNGTVVLESRVGEYGRPFKEHESTMVQHSPFAISEAADEDGIPEGVNLGPAGVHYAGEVFMYFGRTEVMAIGLGKLVDDDLVKEGLDGLEIGHVARCTDDGGIADLV